ncbi:MAG: S-layer homology domain-containing protein [Candidatus Obscuribacterales bacterium]
MRPFFARTLAFVACFGLLLPPAMAARFVDMSGNWTEKYVNNLSDEGVIAAEDDGKFKPDKPVTRAVLAAWLVKVLKLDNQAVGDTPSFPDVRPTDWFYKPVEIIRQNNIIAGYADGFRPHQFIQRAEVITILSRTLSTPTPGAAQIQEALAKYKDAAKVPDWAKVGVAKATLSDIVLIQNPDLLDPSGLASRADTVALLYGLEQYITRQTIAQSESAAPPSQAASSGDWQAAPRRKIRPVMRPHRLAGSTRRPPRGRIRHRHRELTRLQHRERTRRRHREHIRLRRSTAGRIQRKDSIRRPTIQAGSPSKGRMATRLLVIVDRPARIRLPGTVSPHRGMVSRRPIICRAASRWLRLEHISALR